MLQVAFTCVEGVQTVGMWVLCENLYQFGAD